MLSLLKCFSHTYHISMIGSPAANHVWSHHQSEELNDFTATDPLLSIAVQIADRDLLSFKQKD